MGEKANIGEIAVSDVPQRIFASFLETLVTEEVSTDIVERLRKTLLHDEKFSDKALKDALFPEVIEL